MRHDMPKVIIDLPRGGSSSKNRKSRLHLRRNEMNSLSMEMLDDHDSGPGNFSMSRGTKHHGRQDSKSSSDRLGPLRRFLRSRVGRHWNDVHSEMSRELDNRSLIRGKHFWTHVSYEVTTDCFLGSDDKIYHRRWGSLEVYGFYVHPSTGVLCYRERQKYGLTDKSRFMSRLAKFDFSQFERSYEVKNDEWRNFRIVSDLKVLEKKPGGWFIHSFGHHEPYDVVGWGNPDPITGRRSPIYFGNSKGYSSLYRVSSRQLGKKDLKRHKSVITGNPF